MKLEYIRNNIYKYHKMLIAGAGTAFTLLVLITAIANSYQTGITGLTSPGSTGCSCHNTSSSSATSVTVTSQSGSFTVMPGSTTTFTLTISNSAKVAGGTNIAVKTSETGDQNAGTLSPATGSGLRSENGELTHTQPKNMNSGTVSFDFNWTAPTAGGTYYLRALGNAVNLDGNPSTIDQWNRMAVQQIIVASTPEITVTSPNGNEVLCPGSNTNITWTSANVTNVRIDLSDNGGQSYLLNIANNVPAANGTYQWTVPANQPPGNQYRIRISDAATPSTTDDGDNNFTIGESPAITVQPTQLVTVCEGQPASFTVTASGTGLSYQWRRNGTNIQGATQPTYNITSSQTGQAGNIDVVVSGTCGSAATSNASVFTVNPRPAITQGPEAREACLGTATTFNVAATGADLNYQWFRNGVPILNATGFSYEIPSVTAADSGFYTVQVTGLCSPPATSQAARLDIALPPAISVQPQPVTACTGTNSLIKVSATGSGLQFQWRKNGVNVQNATDSVLVFDNITTAMAGSYDVQISGACFPAVTSNSVNLTVNQSVSIIQQPQNQTLVAGSNLNLSVAASGTAISYQWRKDGTNIQNATASTYSIQGLTEQDAGDYDVVLTNTCGSDTSRTAVIDVIPAGNGPILTFAVNTVDFGKIMAGLQVDTTLTGIIINSGNEALDVTGISISGPNASEFEITGGQNQFTLQPDETRSLNIRFRPATGGSKTAVVNIASNSIVTPSLTLSGTGGFIDITSSQGTIDFGSVAVNETKEVTITLTNTGNIDAPIESIEITGTNTLPFSLVAPNQPSDISAGGGIDLTLRFAPVTSGLSSATLRIEIGNGSEPVTIQLTGNGITSVYDEQLAASMNFKAYPNPASESLSISYDPGYAAVQTITVIDVLGNEVARIAIPGDGAIFNWDATGMNGKRLPSGMYNLIIRTDKGMTCLPVSIAR